MILFMPGMFAIAFVLVSVMVIGVQFVPEDGPDPLPFTLVTFPVLTFLFLGAWFTI